MKIKDKTIVITGAGRGIGRALAVRFATQGAHIALLDMNATDLAAATQQCTALGVRAKAYTVDVSREADIGSALDAVVSDFGSLDVIINISSISRHGNAGQSNYSAAKSGVASMTVVWAKELARYGIRVGSIAPGFTHTDILASMKPEVLEKVIAPVPLKRLGQPDEIAHAAQFIIENDFFTGRCLDLDGGLRL